LKLVEIRINWIQKQLGGTTLYTKQSNEEHRIDFKQLQQENTIILEKLQQYEIMFEQSLDAIILFDDNTCFTEVNQAACDLFELPKDQLIGRSLAEFLLLQCSETTLQHDKTLTDSGKLKGEFTIRLRNGRIKQVEFSAQKNASKGLDISVMRDISSRKQLEHQRNVSRQMFIDVYNRAVDGIVIFDRSGKLIDCNHSFLNSFELQKDDLLSTSIYDFVESEYVFKLEKQWRILDEKQRAQGELPVKLKNGIRKVFEFTTTSHIQDNYYMSIMRDVTEKKNMEKRLRKSEQRFRAIFDDALDAIVIWDQQGRVVRANHSASKIFEMSVEKLCQHRLLDFLDEDSPEVVRMLEEFKENGKQRDELDFTMVNGQVKRLEFTSKYKVLDDYNMTIFRNVSERTLMERHLRESENKFRQIYENALNGFVIIDKKGCIVDMNRRAKRILDILHTQENVYPLKLQDFIFREDFKGRDKWEAFLVNANRTGQFIWNNRIIEYSLSKNIYKDHHLAILRDVTEKKEMEDQLKKSETLNIVGELAAGIAHEIRNPMTALKGFIQLLQANVKGDFSLYFDVITSELKRIESIITEFLILAKPQATHYQQRNIKKIIQDTVDLLTPQASLENVQIMLDLMDVVPDLYCEPNQLKQVFINILKNGIEVMPKGGVITVTVCQASDKLIKVSFKDQGCGISEEKIKRLGEPFYTTKERGTGLGLMVSYKIVAEHNGKIEVESKIGEGTTFHIYLPFHFINRIGDKNA
jgi:two-component system, sporulation sensor kinase E